MLAIERGEERFELAVCQRHAEPLRDGADYHYDFDQDVLVLGDDLNAFDDLVVSSISVAQGIDITAWHGRPAVQVILKGRRRGDSIEDQVTFLVADRMVLQRLSEMLLHSVHYLS